VQGGVENTLWPRESVISSAVMMVSGSRIPITMMSGPGAALDGPLLEREHVAHPPRGGDEAAIGPVDVLDGGRR